MLRVNPNVLDLPGVIVTDRNAATDLVRFRPMAEGLEHLDSARLFARYRTHQNDLYDQARHKAEKCAEVLVPDRVDPEAIIGAYVAHQIALASFQALSISLPVEIRGMFF